MPEKKGGGNKLQEFDAENGEYISESHHNYLPIHAFPSILIKLNGDELKVLWDVLKNNDVCKNLQLSYHSNERIGERKIRIKDLIDAIMCPIHVGDEKINAKGEKSIVVIGRNVTFAYNRLTKKITTIYITGERYYKKYEKEDKEKYGI